MYFRLDVMKAVARASCFMVPMWLSGANWVISGIVGFCAAFGWEGDADER